MYMLNTLCLSGHVCVDRGTLASGHVCAIHMSHVDVTACLAADLEQATEQSASVVRIN